MIYAFCCFGMATIPAMASSRRRSNIIELARDMFSPV
jgi:hypothetical protein